MAPGLGLGLGSAAGCRRGAPTGLDGCLAAVLVFRRAAGAGFVGACALAAARLLAVGTGLGARLGGFPRGLGGGVLDSKLFPLRKLRRAWLEGSGPAWRKGTESRYPFCASRRYGGVGAGALPLGSMRYKHDSEDNEDEDTNLQKVPVYKKM